MHLMRWLRTARAGLVLLALGLGLPIAHADTWRSAAELTQARGEHTATLLPSGQVLVAGGRGSDATFLANVELYDADRNMWHGAHALAAARANHSATLLPSGKVLVVGGQNASGYLASVELYDPTSDIWTSAGNISSARAWHTATLLDSGRVLIAGGVAANGALASVELYDPATNTWSGASDLATARYDHGAALLPTGEVLVSAGYDVNAAALASAEIYDPVEDAWHFASDLGAARHSYTAALLISGRLLAVGGTDLGASAEIYDPVADIWNNAGSPAHDRTFHTATLLPSGRLLVTGGAENGIDLASTETYDAASDTWTAAAALATGRRLHTATLLTSGKVLVAGGYSSGGSLASAEIYDPASDGWAIAGSLVEKHQNNNATLLPSGNVLLIAGSRNGFASETAEQYDVAADSWSTAGSLAMGRVSATATLLMSGKVLVAGGYTGNIYLGSVELYDPVSRTSSPAGSLASVREYHTATLLASGKVLVVGGFANAGYLAGVEIYDPASNTWSSAASLPSARGMHTATLLSSGKVLVAGGTGNGTTGVLDAELYDPSTNSWSNAGQLAIGRFFHTATMLASGKVLVAGGRGPAYRTSAELYDPATNTWSSAGNLAAMRYLHAAALLPTGEVLVVGGSDNNPIASTELYDPASNSWSLAGNLSAARVAPSALALPTGDILVVGGGNNSIFGGLTTTERYTRHVGMDNGRRPLVTAPTNPIAPGDVLGLSGQGFTGDSEGSGGGTQASPTNSPLVQLRRIDSDQIVWTSPASNSDRSDVSYRSAPLSGLPGGHYAMTLSVDAVPSLSRVIEVAPTYTVVPSANGAGRISPDTTQFVASGVTTAFTLAPDIHHHAEVSGSCGGALAGMLFVTSPINTDCTVVADFVIDTHTLTYVAEANGSIDGTSPQTVSYGDSGTAVSAVPDTGYSFSQWSDGSTANPRTDVDVTADVSVSATFAINTYMLTYAAGTGGSISGLTPQTIEYGADGNPVAAVPDAGHHFAHWSDGSTSNPRTDVDVTADIDVTAVFALDTFAVTATAGANGSITPTAQSVDYGSSAVFNVLPDAGYTAILSGDTCTAAQTGVSSWASSPITADCAISATFAPIAVPLVAIEVSDSRDYVGYDAVLEYIVTVANIGTGEAAGITLTNTLPAQLDAANATWVCNGAGNGAECDAMGTGALDTGNIVIPAGRALTWLVTAPVLRNAIGTTIDYTVGASLDDDAGVSATDTNTLVIFRGGFDANE